MSTRGLQNMDAVAGLRRRNSSHSECAMISQEMQGQKHGKGNLQLTNVEETPKAAQDAELKDYV